MEHDDDLDYDQLPNDGDDENLDDGLDGEHGDDVPSDDDSHDDDNQDGNDGDDDEKHQDEPPKQSSISQDYIAELIRKQAETEQQLAQSQKQPMQAPNIEDFDDWGEYQQALRSFERDSLKAELLAELKAEQAQQASIQQQAETIAVLDELASEGVDMGAVMAKAEQLPPLPVTLDKFGLSTKETMLFAKDLVENTELYYELAQLNPYQFSARIGAMIEQRKSQSSQNNTPKPKQSKAPPPIKTVKANQPASKNIYDMSDEEFFKARGLS